MEFTSARSPWSLVPLAPMTLAITSSLLKNHSPSPSCSALKKFNGTHSEVKRRTAKDKTSPNNKLLSTGYNQMNAQNVLTYSLTYLHTNTPVTKSHLVLLHEPLQKQITCKISWYSSDPYVQQESYTEFLIIKILISPSSKVDVALCRNQKA